MNYLNRYVYKNWILVHVGKITNLDLFLEGLQRDKERDRNAKIENQKKVSSKSTGSNFPLG